MVCTTSRKVASVPPRITFSPSTGASTAAICAATTSCTEIHVADPGGTTRSPLSWIGRINCLDQFAASYAPRMLTGLRITVERRPERLAALTSCSAAHLLLP